jgi:endonuclease/exonuclease/phosphatase (EEP) superfamily protein YafD
MKQWLLHLFQYFFQLSIIAAALLSLAGFLGKLHYLLELTVHFKWQYLVVGCIAAVFFALKQQQAWLVLSLCVVLLNLRFILPWYLPTNLFSRSVHPISLNSPIDRPVSLKLLLANVNAVNRNYKAVIDLIESTNPDIFAVIETNQTWLTQLKPITSLLPHSVQSPNAGGFGVALYSKLPLTPVAIPYLPPSTISSVKDYHVAATIEINQVPITVIAAHPPPPRISDLANLRDQELKNLGNFVQANPSTTVVLGDLNTTMWTSAYQQLEQQSGLRNACKGFGVLPTWSTELSLLMIPIDHGLISSDFKVLDIKTGPNIGSDHLPLIIDLERP